MPLPRGGKAGKAARREAEARRQRARTPSGTEPTPKPTRSKKPNQPPIKAKPGKKRRKPDKTKAPDKEPNDGPRPTPWTTFIGTAWYRIWGTDDDPTWLHTIAEPFPKTTRRVSRPFAIIIFVLNLAPIPGLGTIIYGKWERGILQFMLTFLFLLGWIWALSDSIRILRHTTPAGKPTRPTRPPQRM